jgi:Fur family transcriptional regulator, zinc uptake regulator
MVTSATPNVPIDATMPTLKPLKEKTPLACRPHDHARCVADALQAAEQVCSRRGARLTALRKRVLQLVWHSHQPLGAYEILATLSAEDGRIAAPPTVYRALDFLQENGLVHRIASQNAFIGCNHPGEIHQGQFLICRQCHSAIELQRSNIEQAVQDSASGLGFLVEGQTVEIVGLCSRCREPA